MKFKTIVIDPPWQYGKWGKASIAPRGSSYEPNDSIMPYKTMSIEEIKALPIGGLAAENCDLYLWTTQKYLPVSFEVLQEWGFKYCQTLIWCKTPMGTGQGGLYTPTNEFLILGRRGRMPKKTRMNTTWWQVKRTGKGNHSKKPEHFQDVIEQQSDEPRLEMFARRKREGWFSWGNEVESDIEINMSERKGSHKYTVPVIKGMAKLGIYKNTISGNLFYGVYRKNENCANRIKPTRVWLDDGVICVSIERRVDTHEEQ